MDNNIRFTWVYSFSKSDAVNTLHWLHCCHLAQQLSFRSFKYKAFCIALSTRYAELKLKLKLYKTLLWQYLYASSWVAGTFVQELFGVLPCFGKSQLSKVTFRPSWHNFWSRWARGGDCMRWWIAKSEDPWDGSKEGHMKTSFFVPHFLSLEMIRQKMRKFAT